MKKQKSAPRSFWSFSQWIESRTGPFLLAILGLFVGSTVLTSLLFMNLRPDIEELLPLNSPSLIDWDHLRSKVRSTDFLGILIQNPDASTRAELATRLAQNLRDLQDPAVAGIEEGPGDLSAWGSRHGAYLIPLSTLESLERMVRKAIQTKQFTDAPFELLKKERDQAKIPPSRFDSAKDQTAVVIAHLTPEGSRMKNSFALKKAVESAWQKTPGNEKATLRYTGPVENLLEEHDALIEDLNISAIITVALCGSLMVFFFGSISATLVLLASLGVGTVCTFAFGYLAIGYVNSNTAFLASIIIGNGINFGIIYLARFLEERRKSPKGNWAEQLDIAMRETWKGTWTAALAAGFAYGSLLATDFRGFQQFALMGLIGMLLCWLSSVTVLPAMILHWRKRITTRLPRVDPGFQMSRFLEARGVATLSVIFFSACTLVCVLALSSNRALVIESDLNKVRNRESMVSGAGSLQPVFERATQRKGNPILIWAPTEEQRKALETEIETARAPGGRLHGLVERVLSPSQVLPLDQEQKTVVLKKLRALLPKDLLDFIPAAQRKDLSTFLNSTPVTPQDLPEELRSAFADRSGNTGKIFYIEPVADDQLLAGDRLKVLIQGLREILSKHEGKMAGQLPVASDIVSSIEKDGPQATLYALLAVALLVVISFHRISAIVPLLAALCLAVLWLIGTMAIFDMRLNFINFIALPITFGIGVDYSVNLFQRYLVTRATQQDRRASMLDAVSNVGGPVLMASLTTIIGYGSLLIARNQGFVSLGQIAVLGEVTCLLSALVLLPSLLLLGHHLTQRRRNALR